VSSSASSAAPPAGEVDAERAVGVARLGLDAEELVACVACGLCLPHCPTYRVTGLEVASPRGRIAAMRRVQSGEAPVDTAFVAAMDECVQCRGCEAACPSSVPFGRLMEGTRSALHREHPGRHSWVRRILEGVGYRVVLPRRWLLRMLSWPLMVAQRVHLVPQRFGVPRLSTRALRTSLSGVPIDEADSVLFTGCVMDAWQRPVHGAALDVMRAAGAAPALSDARASCCGALHAHAGRIDEARALARKVIAAAPGTAPIVVDSAGCGAAMKEYGHLLGTAEAATFAARVQDFSEWLDAYGDLELRPTGRRVVVQDPCHLAHVQHAATAVHRVLAGGYDVVGTGDDGLCCGAGGAYAAVEPHLAGAIRDRKISAIRAAAGDAPVLVASANPGCAMHLAAAGLEVRHPAELLAAAVASAPHDPDPERHG
jgi:glycolate oxidase iron-sulfur subunit